jgi:tRNA pseudouridine38-40 synthase
LSSESYPHAFWAAASPKSTKEEDLARKRQFRVSAEAIELLRETARRYEGSHNFHNFTVGREYGDRSCVRIMKKIEVSLSSADSFSFKYESALFLISSPPPLPCFWFQVADPVVHGSTEWIAVMFHGQSFMLHQVRCFLASS